MLPVSLRPLFETSEPAELGPGGRPGTMPEAGLRASLSQIADGAGLTGQRRQAVLALLLLWHDHLDASHVLSQGMDNPEGSFVHALMHRREPDYGNACYWWRRVGSHVVFDEIGARAAAHLESVDRADLAGVLAPKGTWDPVAFTAACERVAGHASDEAEDKLLRELQRIEFEVLLEHLAS